MAASSLKLKLLYLADLFVAKTDENHGVTVNDMIDFLAGYDIKAERKSIYDDVDCLIQYGYDIEKYKDPATKKMYYKLMSKEFELAELKLLVDAVQSSKFITEKKSEELIKKIEKNCSKYEAKDLQRQVFIQDRVKNPNEMIFVWVDNIHRAIHDDCQIEFVYTFWNTNKQLVEKNNGKLYHVSPWALSWDDENYYLIGYDSDDDKIKHFRVDKIKNLNLTDKKRQGDTLYKSLNLANYSKKTFGMYGGKEETVRLHVPNYLVGVIFDRFGTDVYIIPDKEDKNYFYVNVCVAVSRQFFGWVVGLGNEVSIVEPSVVVDEFTGMLEDMLKAHK